MVTFNWYRKCDGVTTWSGCDFLTCETKFPNVSGYRLCTGWHSYFHRSLIEANTKSTSWHLNSIDFCVLYARTGRHTRTQTQTTSTSITTTVPYCTTHTATRPASRFHGWTQTNTSEWVNARWLGPGHLLTRFVVEPYMLRRRRERRHHHQVTSAFLNSELRK